MLTMHKLIKSNLSALHTLLYSQIILFYSGSLQKRRHCAIFSRFNRTGILFDSIYSSMKTLQLNPGSLHTQIYAPGVNYVNT